MYETYKYDQVYRYICTKAYYTKDIERNTRKKGCVYDNR